MKRREPNTGIPWTVGCEAETPLLLEAHRLTLDVERSLQCRNCKPNCPINGPRHSWEFMRAESEATEILGVDAELKVNFECVNCHSIHLGVPLPAKGLFSEVQSWSMADEVVRGTFGSISSCLRVRAVTPRKANSMASRSRDASPHETAAEEEAAARSVAPSSVEEEESVGSRDVEEATVGREGGVQRAPTSGEGDGGTEADTEAAISRASASLRKGKNPATPRL